MNKKQAPINKKYDLEERTAKFGESVIEIAMKVPRNEITRPLITQLVKAATSVGANYSEADDAVSKRDFKNKIGICKKESRESKHFLRMLTKAVPVLKEKIKPIWQEAKELNLIFNAIFLKIK
jgi:four helix bundle protein